jgi:hypothetical protein
MISAARQRVGDRDIEWIVGDAETYPPPEGHYDAIISQMGLTGSSEAPRLNCVACGSSSRYFCASGLMRWAASTSRRQTHPAGLATALCRRSRLSRLTIRVLELRRCNDWAQIQDRVSGPLNRSVSCEGSSSGIHELSRKRVITSAGKVCSFIKCACPQAHRPRHACLSNQAAIGSFSTTAANQPESERR